MTALHGTDHTTTQACEAAAVLVRGALVMGP